MALIVTEGIVLRTVKYSDNTVISNILTPHKGVISVIASKSNKSSASVMNYLRVMNVLTFTLYPAKNNGLHRVKEMHFTYIFQRLNVDVMHSMYGFVITETVYALQSNNISESDGLFFFLKKWLEQFDENPADQLMWLFEGIKELLILEGIFPEINYSEVNCCFNMSEGIFMQDHHGGIHTLERSKSKLLAYLLSEHDVHADVDQIYEIIDSLYIYITIHIPNFKIPKSWSILKEMSI